jgi:hypothetical protein
MVPTPAAARYSLQLRLADAAHLGQQDVARITLDLRFVEVDVHAVNIGRAPGPAKGLGEGACRLGTVAGIKVLSRHGPVALLFADSGRIGERACSSHD